MSADVKSSLKTIMDRQKLMDNPEGCPACGQKFNLGDPVVSACGPWGEKPALIHESDAVYDPEIQMYVEREWYDADKPA